MRKRRGVWPLALSTLPYLVDAAVVHPESITRPDLDIASLGQLGVYGNFDALTRYSYQGQGSVLESASPFDGIISQPDSTTFLYSPLVNGRITASCRIDDTRVIIAGNFTQVFNQSAQGIAYLDLSNGRSKPLGDLNLTGKVRALYCNQSDIFVGGDFEYSGTYGVAVWNSAQSNWSKAPWDGFAENSVVTAIAEFGDSLVFGGNLTGLSGTFASNSTDAKEAQQQLIPYSTANVSSSNGAEDQSDSNIFCPGGNGWKALDNDAVATLDISFGSSIIPARVRVYNLANDGDNGVKTFRLITHPANGIMNLTWTDEDNNSHYCDAECPLPLSQNNTFVDFTFVNQVQTTSAQLMLLEHYGDHAGLGSIQFYQDNTYISPISDWNLPLACQGTSSAAQVDLRGSWSESIQNQTGERYMLSNVESSSALSEDSVVFSPNVDAEAIYTIQLFTPGCAASSDCSTRGQVNVTVDSGTGEPSHSTLLYQTNEQMKYDVVYKGPFSPQGSIKISPVSGQQLPLAFVAGEIVLTWEGTVSQTSISNIFEYSPGNFSMYSQNTSFAPVGSSFLNVLGTELGKGSVVNALVAANDTLYIGGLITNSSGSNLIAVSEDTTQDVAIQGQVGSLQRFENKIIAVSDSVYAITGTEAEKVFNESAVVVPFEYNGTSLWTFSTTTGLTLYDPNSMTLNEGPITANGHLSQQFRAEDANFYVGSLQIQQRASGGAVQLDQTFAPAALPFQFISSQNAGENYVYAAAYSNDSVAFVAGHFMANTSNSEIAHNVVAVNGSVSYPLFAQGELRNANFSNAASNGTVVVLSGSAQGTLRGSEINGLVIYNTSDKAFLNISTPLSGSAQVNQVLFRPNTTQIIVAGDFEGPKTVNCTNLCLYDVSKDEWKPAASRSLDNAIIQADMLDQDNVLVLLRNGDLATVTLHNGTLSTWAQKTLPKITSFAISENATTIFASGYGNGSNSVVGYWMEDRWTEIAAPYDNATSRVNALSILPTISDKNTSSVLGNSILLVSGLLQVPGYGQVSTMTFDGDNWTPLFKASRGNGDTNANILSKVYAKNDRKILPPGYKIGSEKPGSSSPSGPESPSTEPDRDYMSRGRVVGISCAIAIGCVSLLLILGLLASWIGSRSAKHQYSTMRVSEKDMTAAYTPEALRGIFSR